MRDKIDLGTFTCCKCGRKSKIGETKREKAGYVFICNDCLENDPDCRPIEELTAADLRELFEEAIERVLGKIYEKVCNPKGQ